MVFDFSFNIKVIAIKPFPLIFWLDSDYFEYRKRSTQFFSHLISSILALSVYIYIYAANYISFISFMKYYTTYTKKGEKKRTHFRERERILSTL